MMNGEKLIIACPECATLNRVPAERLSDGAKCGKCASSLFPGQPVELTTENFEKHAQSSDIPLVVDFWAEWCGPCRQMEAGYASAASRVEPRLRLGKINTETEQALSARFGIQSIPSIILLSKGQEVARTTGAMPETALLRWIESALAESQRHFPAQSIDRP